MASAYLQQLQPWEEQTSPSPTEEVENPYDLALSRSRSSGRKLEAANAAAKNSVNSLQRQLSGDYPQDAPSTAWKRRQSVNSSQPSRSLSSGSRLTQQSDRSSVSSPPQSQAPPLPTSSSNLALNGQQQAPHPSLASPPSKRNPSLRMTSAFEPSPTGSTSSVNDELGLGLPNPAFSRKRTGSSARSSLISADLSSLTSEELWHAEQDGPVDSSNPHRSAMERPLDTVRRMSKRVDHSQSYHHGLSGDVIWPSAPAFSEEVYAPPIKSRSSTNIPSLVGGKRTQRRKNGRKASLDMSRVEPTKSMPNSPKDVVISAHSSSTSLASNYVKPYAMPRPPSSYYSRDFLTSLAPREGGYAVAATYSNNFGSPTEDSPRHSISRTSSRAAPAAPSTGMGRWSLDGGENYARMYGTPSAATTSSSISGPSVQRVTPDPSPPAVEVTAASPPLPNGAAPAPKALSVDTSSGPPVPQAGPSTSPSPQVSQTNAPIAPSPLKVATAAEPSVSGSQEPTPTSSKPPSNPITTSPLSSLLHRRSAKQLAKANKAAEKEKEKAETAKLLEQRAAATREAEAKRKEREAEAQAKAAAEQSAKDEAKRKETAAKQEQMRKEQATVAAQEEAKRKEAQTKAEAARKEAAAKEEARRKDLADKDAIRRKELAEKEAVKRKELADKAAAKRKEAAEKEAAKQKEKEKRKSEGRGSSFFGLRSSKSTKDVSRNATSSKQQAPTPPMPTRAPPPPPTAVTVAPATPTPASKPAVPQPQAQAAVPRVEPASVQAQNGPQPFPQMQNTPAAAPADFAPAAPRHNHTSLPVDVLAKTAPPAAKSQSASPAPPRPGTGQQRSSSTKAAPSVKNRTSMFGTLKKRFSVLGSERRTTTPPPGTPPNPAKSLQVLRGSPSKVSLNSRTPPPSKDLPPVPIPRDSPVMQTPSKPTYDTSNPGSQISSALPPRSTSRTPPMSTPPRMPPIHAGPGRQSPAPITPNVARSTSQQAVPILSSPLSNTATPESQHPPRSSASPNGSLVRRASSVRGPRPMPAGSRSQSPNSPGSPAHEPSAPPSSFHLNDTQGMVGQLPDGASPPISVNHHQATQSVLGMQGSQPILGGVAADVVTPSTSGESSLFSHTRTQSTERTNTDVVSPMTSDDGGVVIIDADSREPSFDNPAENGHVGGKGDQAPERENSEDTIHADIKNVPPPISVQ